MDPLYDDIARRHRELEALVRSWKPSTLIRALARQPVQEFRIRSSKNGAHHLVQVDGLDGVVSLDHLTSIVAAEVDRRFDGDRTLLA